MAQVEDQAFWVLCSAFEDLLPRDMCSPGFSPMPQMAHFGLKGRTTRGPPAFRGVRIIGAVLQQLAEERLAQVPHYEMTTGLLLDYY